MTKSNLPAIPKTDYLLAYEGDTWSEPCITCFDAWGDVQVEQIQKEAFNKALDLAINIVDNATTPDGWSTVFISEQIEKLKEKL